MSEHSAGGQTFTTAVAEPGPDNALRWPEKKAKCSDGLCRGSSKDISHGGCCFSVRRDSLVRDLPQGLFCTLHALYPDHPSTEVCGDRRADGWLMNFPPASGADRLQLPPSWSVSRARLPEQGSLWVCQGMLLRNQSDIAKWVHITEGSQPAALLSFCLTVPTLRENA